MKERVFMYINGLNFDNIHCFINDNLYSTKEELQNRCNKIVHDDSLFTFVCRQTRCEGTNENAVTWPLNHENSHSIGLG